MKPWIFCAALLLALTTTACGASAPAAGTAAAETTAATAAETAASPGAAAEAALTEILRSAAESGATGAAGTQNADYARKILDWSAQYQSEDWAKDAAAAFAASLDETARNTFKTDQIQAVLASAILLEPDGAALTAAFRPIFEAFGLTLPHLAGADCGPGCGTACGGDLLNLTGQMPYSADFEGDGQQETIEVYQTAGTDGETQYALRITKGGQRWEFDKMNFEFSPDVYLGDPDGDAVPELLVSADTGSDDPEVFGWKLTANGPAALKFGSGSNHSEEGRDDYAEGSLLGLGDNSDILIRSKVYLLGTYWGAHPFRFQDGVLTPVDGVVWNFTDNAAKLTAKVPLEALAADGRNGADTGKTLALPAGTKLTATGSDNAGSVWFVLSDGTTFGRFALKKVETGWSIGTVSEWDAFEWLPYAD